jgi:hypothetical protein
VKRRGGEAARRRGGREKGEKAEIYPAKKYNPLESAGRINICLRASFNIEARPAEKFKDAAIVMQSARTSRRVVESS